MVAEKLEAAVLFGAANTRLKDFFDLWYLSRRFTFEGSLLIEAITQTFARRETAVPADIPTALTDLFAVQKSAQWTAFLRRNSLAPVEFLSALAALRDFLLPVLQTILAKAFFHRTWEPGQGWRSRAVQWLVNIVSSTRALIEQRLVPAACLAAAPK